MTPAAPDTPDESSAFQSWWHEDHADLSEADARALWVATVGKQDAYKLEQQALNDEVNDAPLDAQKPEPPPDVRKST